LRPLLHWKGNKYYIFGMCVCIVAFVTQNALHFTWSFVTCMALQYFATLSHKRHDFRKTILNISGPGSLVGIATDYGLDGPGSNLGGKRFSARPDRPWGPPSLLYNGYRVFPGGKVRPGRASDHSPPSSAAVMEQ